MFRVAAAALLISSIAFAQNAPIASPPAQATASLGGKEVVIHYGAPSMRGRKIMGQLVPFGQVWRTGANDATSLDTPVALTIGNLKVPAGSYTLYTLPAAEPAKWQLIINKQTKQWGTEYHAEQDLGRVPMQHANLPKPQEVMSISFEHTSGKTTELHVRWENTDESVKVTAQ